MNADHLYTIEKETELWRDGDEVILTVSVEYPLFSGNTRAVRKINKYYKKRNKRFIDICKASLLPKSANSDVKPITAELHSKVTYFDDSHVSVIADTAFNRFAEPSRHGDIWNLKTGVPEQFSAIFSSTKKALKNYVIGELERYVERRLGNYYPDAIKRAERHFTTKNTFISSEGKLVLFFQPNTIAPRGEGFVQFEFRD